MSDVIHRNHYIIKIRKKVFFLAPVEALIETQE
jgi:hypothetical protein